MDALDVLTRALKLEDDGRKAYELAAKRSQDPETVQVFKQLAEDEIHHATYIQRQVDALQAGKPWVAIPELESVAPLDEKDPVFPAGKKAIEALPPESSDEDALLFGLSAEIKSYELYRQSAGDSENPDARQMFERLASAERKHFELLMMRYESRYGYPR